MAEDIGFELGHGVFLGNSREEENPVAARNRELFAQSMTPGQVAEAQRRSFAFVARKETAPSVPIQIFSDQ